jgi:uncharacterized membrane protein
MSELISIAYPDEPDARRARTTLAAEIGKGLIEVEDMVVVTYEEDGRIAPVLGGWDDGFEAAGGAVAGGLIALILVGPLLGLAVGGAVAGGAAWKSKLSDTGIPETFVYELWDSLAPGTAALIVLVRELSPAEVLPHLHQPGHVVHTSLSDEVEAQLDAAIGR